MMTDSYLQAIEAASSFVASCLGAIALLYSMIAYTRSLRIANYNELDKNYQTLLNIALANPSFTTPEEIISQEQRHKYDIYAFMVWNFLEAIYDKSIKDKYLKETWLPIIEVEGATHSKWFMREDNKPKFKEVFYNYVETLLKKNSVI